MSETNKDPLEEFLLKGSDAEDTIPVERQPWKRLGMYKSPVCLAVHLEVSEALEAPTASENPKRALFRYLQGLNQVLLELGMVYPVIAVIQGNTGANDTVETWGSDQAWHRGGFSLYLEEDEKAAKARLADLLDPVAEAMKEYPREEHRNEGWFANELEKIAEGFETKNKGYAQEVAALCAAFVKPDEDQKNGAEAFQKLKGWPNRTIEKARRTLAKGEGA